MQARLIRLLLAFAVTTIGILAVSPSQAAGASGAPPTVHATLIHRESGIGERPIGSVLPIRLVRNIAFSTRTVGYGLSGGEGTYPLKTTNGGRTWRVDGPAFFLPIADAPAEVGQLTALGPKEAYAYSGPGSGSAIDITTDGGKRWWGAYLGGALVAVAPYRNSLWVLVVGAAPTSSVNTAPPMWLYVSSDGGRTWKYRSSLGTVLGWEADLVRPSATTAYALVTGFGDSSPSDEHVVATSDGGRSWAVRSDPCRERFDGYAVDSTQRLLATSTSLWLFCGGEAGAGKQAKLVERSSDGGRSWRLVASHTPGEHVAENDIPLAGDLPEPGTTGVLVAMSPSVVWLVLAGSNLVWKTTDGGHNWVEAAPVGIEEQLPQQLSPVNGTVLVETARALWREVHDRWQLVAGADVALSGGDQAAWTPMR